jgi:hypothetical protein
MSNEIRDTIADITNSPNKLADKPVGPQGLLSRAFRNAMRELNITADVWAAYMMDYIADPSNGYPKNPKDRMTARGNLNKEFADRKMTWKTYLKAMKFLKLNGLVLNIQLDDGTTVARLKSGKSGMKSISLDVKFN